MATEELAMPPSRDAGTPEFSERLWVPWWWWLLATPLVAMFGPYVFLGFGTVAAIITYLVLGGIVAAFLLRWASPVRVIDGTLYVASTAVPLHQVTDVRVLPRDEAREVLAGWPEPTSVVLLRGYVRKVVYVCTDGEGVPAYLLISSRRPDALTAAVGLGLQG